MTMGERIKQLRKEKKMTQDELAQTLGITKGTVSTWERNNRKPSFEALAAMSSLFDHRMEYILGTSDDESSPALTAEEETGLALSQIEEDLSEYAVKYARLDQFGREAVEAVIRAEYNRCRAQNTLCPAAAYSACIHIQREEVTD